jgi:hypothetical protein
MEDWEDQDRLLVRVGGSHKLMQRQYRAFEAAGIPIRGVGSASLGSKAQHAIIPDTIEARALLKRVKGSVVRAQWSWLKVDKGLPS